LLQKGEVYDLAYNLLFVNYFTDYVVTPFEAVNQKRNVFPITIQKYSYCLRLIILKTSRALTKINLEYFCFLVLLVY
jgi:hypothetical protein